MSTCTLLINTPKRRAGAGWLVGALAALLLTVPVVAATSQGDTAAEAERPRLTVFRSRQNIYAQVIDDSVGRTLASASTIDKEIAKQVEGKNKGGWAARAALSMIALRKKLGA